MCADTPSPRLTNYLARNELQSSKHCSATSLLLPEEYLFKQLTTMNLGAPQLEARDLCHPMPESLNLPQPGPYSTLTSHDQSILVAGFGAKRYHEEAHPSSSLVLH